MFLPVDTDIILQAEPQRIWEYCSDPANWTASNPTEHFGLRFFNASNRPETGVEFHQRESVAGVYADLRGRVLIARPPHILVWTGMARYKLLAGLLRVSVAEGGVMTIDEGPDGTKMAHNVFMNFPDSPWGRLLNFVFERVFRAEPAVYEHSMRELVYFKRTLEGARSPAQEVAA